MYPHDTTKRCTKCGDEKPLSEFHKRAASPDGLRPMCKACVKTYQAEWRLDPRYAEEIRQKAAKIRQRPDYYVRNLDYQAVYRERRRNDPARMTKRIDNARDYERQQYRENPDFRHRKIVRAHRMRAKPCKDGYTRLEWETLCARYDHRCLCCGERKPLTADHVTPLSRGGSNTIENIQPLCLACNDRKHTKTTDYRPTQPPTEFG